MEFVRYTATLWKLWQRLMEKAGCQGSVASETIQTRVEFRKAVLLRKQVTVPCKTGGGEQYARRHAMPWGYRGISQPLVVHRRSLLRGLSDIERCLHVTILS
jgi:hypothetical protein